MQHRAVSTLQRASEHSMKAHRALGRMSASATLAEFTDAAAELIASLREISSSLETLAKNDRRRAFAAWFAKHGLHSELLKIPATPAVYISRLPRARGSEPPPIRGSMAEDFYFEGADKRPAIQLCAEFLERVTTVLDQTKRFGLE
jgi:hypothetical protein